MSVRLLLCSGCFCVAVVAMCQQVWSAPNYCYRCGNVASVLAFDDNLGREFRLFKEVPESQQTTPQRATVPYFL